MNTIIFNLALLMEALVNRVIRLPFARTFTAVAVAAPLALLGYATYRYSDALARATVVVLGSERIVVGLLAVLVVRAVLALVFDYLSERFYRPDSDAPATLV